MVKFWVRNLVRSDFAFWLSTSSDRFYPDFVAQLKDGRFLVAEYKGEDREGTPRAYPCLPPTTRNASLIFPIPYEPIPAAVDRTKPVCAAAFAR